MARSEFALGVAVGGLAGVAVGYLISRNGHTEAEPPLAAIDLTPARDAGPVEPLETAEKARPARARRKEATETQG
jgi:hypothetical protein